MLIFKIFYAMIFHINMLCIVSIFLFLRLSFFITMMCFWKNDIILIVFYLLFVLGKRIVLLILLLRREKFLFG